MKMLEDNKIYKVILERNFAQGLDFSYRQWDIIIDTYVIL